MDPKSGCTGRIHGVVNVAICSNGFFSMSGTIVPSAGYPTAKIKNAFSCTGLPRMPFKNPIGLGVCVSDTSPAL